MGAGLDRSGISKTVMSLLAQGFAQKQQLDAGGRCAIMHGHMDWEVEMVACLLLEGNFHPVERSAHPRSHFAARLSGIPGSHGRPHLPRMPPHLMAGPSHLPTPTLRPLIDRLESHWHLAKGHMWPSAPVEQMEPEHVSTPRYENTLPGMRSTREASSGAG